MERSGSTSADVSCLPVYDRSSILQVSGSLDPRSCCSVNATLYYNESCYYVRCEKYIVKANAKLSQTPGFPNPSTRALGLKSSGSDPCTPKLQTSPPPPLVSSSCAVSSHAICLGLPLTDPRPQKPTISSSSLLHPRPSPPTNRRNEHNQPPTHNPQNLRSQTHPRRLRRHRSRSRRQRAPRLWCHVLLHPVHALRTIRHKFTRSHHGSLQGA